MVILGLLFSNVGLLVMFGSNVGLGFIFILLVLLLELELLLYIGFGFPLMILLLLLPSLKPPLKLPRLLLATTLFSIPFTRGPVVLEIFLFLSFSYFFFKFEIFTSNFMILEIILSFSLLLRLRLPLISRFSLILSFKLVLSLLILFSVLALRIGAAHLPIPPMKNAPPISSFAFFFSKALFFSILLLATTLLIAPFTRGPVTLETFLFSALFNSFSKILRKFFTFMRYFLDLSASSRLDGTLLMFISRFNSILLFKFLSRALRSSRFAFFICLFHIPILPRKPATCFSALFLTCRRLFSSCFLDVLLSCLFNSAAALKLLLALFPLAALFALFLLLF